MSTQTAREPSCPNATTLSQFLHDELLGAEASSVETHIEACPNCQEVLNGLVGAITGPLDVLGTLSGKNPHDADTEPPSEPSTEAPSTTSIHLPGYEVLGVLGRGGMGVVYQARQLRPNRIVAVKVLLSGRHASSKERVRFLREAGAVAQLQHPYIVSLYEAGEHGELPYLTLEFISGGSLADLLRSTPLPARDAARLVEQLARGMHYAHERGIVHRDLKPANVLLQIADLGLQRDANATGVFSYRNDKLTLSNLETAIPKITDFGLAKNISAGASLSSSHAVCGTPSYMAPEQASGPEQGVGVAADVYALGAILYQCLTSRPPFLGPTAADTLLQVMSEEPVPPTRLQPTVPDDLQTICMKCLQKKSHQRYGSALELAEDLRRFQAGEAILARPVGRWERAVKWCRRRPAVAGLLAAVILLTLLAGGLVTWQWRQAVAALAEARSEKTARAQRQVTALPDAAPGSVPAILEELEANREEVLPLLRNRYQEEKNQLRRMRLALALLPVDGEALRVPLMDWLLHAEDPAEVLLARQALQPYQAELSPLLWAKVENVETPANVRFRASVALASYATNDDRWRKLGPEVVEHLLWTNPLHRGIWTEALRPLGQNLLDPLTQASYFPLNAGTKWHYRADKGDGTKDVITTEIAKIEKIDGQALARLETLSRGEVIGSEHLSSTSKGLFRHRYNGTEISPPVRLLSFPIQTGQTWESEHKHGKVSFKATCRIGNEEIEVPAGKYKAVKLHLDFESGKARFSTSLWFAPGVGIVKQSVGAEGKMVTLELEKFEKGQDE